MKIIATIAFLLISASMAFSQKETLSWTDTVQISSNIPKMVFNYYRSDEEYAFKNTKCFGRFEIYKLGDNVPFQQDTLIGVSRSYYKDLNGDHNLDLTIVTMEGTSGGGDFRVYYLYNPKINRFQYWRSDPSDQ